MRPFALLLTFFSFSILLLSSVACKAPVVRNPRLQKLGVRAGQAVSVGAPFVQAKVVWIPKGSFLMGAGRYETKPAPKDEKQHKVSFRKGFWMWQTEVTQGQYKALTGKNPSHFKKCGLRCPVESVSFAKAALFANALSRRQGLNECFTSDGKQLKAKYRGSKLYDTCDGWRLPTESEWEYAARAGTKTIFSTGGCISSKQANFAGKVQYWVGCPTGVAREKTIPVNSFKPNPWGLFDMHGNVWEWTLDKYKRDNTGFGSLSPLNASDGKSGCIRGGGWDGSIRAVRSAIRSSFTGHSSTLGFRLVKSPK